MHITFGEEPNLNSMPKLKNAQSKPIKISKEYQNIGRKLVQSGYYKKITFDFWMYNSKLDNIVYENKLRVLNKRHANINIL